VESKTRILVVDDEYFCRDILLRYLSKYSPCDEAVDGVAALEAWKRAHEEGSPYDIVFLDIMLPIMNGQDVLKAMREWEYARGIPAEKSCGIIIMSALREPGSVVESFGNQCDGYLIKPCNSADVEKAIGKIRERIRRGFETGAAVR
jgi:two-component system chemotaxis response regulator CheY